MKYDNLIISNDGKIRKKEYQEINGRPLITVKSLNIRQPVIHVKLWPLFREIEKRDGFVKVAVLRREAIKRFPELKNHKIVVESWIRRALSWGIIVKVDWGRYKTTE